VQTIALASSLAILKAGSNKAARIAIIAITTSSSIRVKTLDLNFIVFMMVNDCVGEMFCDF
jgi:hypothetical protein